MNGGKVLGAMLGLALGLLIGGPLAIVVLVLVGTLAGHQYDLLYAPPEEVPTGAVPFTRAALDIAAQEHFARHLCALFLEVARADGDLVRDEVRVVREYFAHQLRSEPEVLELVRRTLKERHQRTPSLEAATAACREEMPTAERLLLLDTLYTLALVDGQLQRAEQEALHRVARGLGLSEQEQRAAATRHLGEADPHYARLGLTPQATDAEVKSAFRQLAATHHPDRVAHLGPGATEQASRRFQEIREAYEQIRRQRKL